MKRWVFAPFSLAVWLLASLVSAEEEPRAVLAVLEIEDQTSAFTPQVLSQATDHLRTKLAATGRFTIIDKGQQEAKLKEMMKKEKKDSYQECRDESCQIPLGKELSADTLLRSKITKLGSSYTLACEMVNLMKEATDYAAEAQFDGTEDGLAMAIGVVVGKLAGRAVETSEGPVVQGGEVKEGQATGPRVKKGTVAGSRTRLIVNAGPAEATITITVEGPDGFKQTETGSLWEVGGLKAGTYLIRVEAPNHQTERKEVILKPDKTVSEDITLRRFGGLEVRGEPEGAKVVITGPNGFRKEFGMPVTARDLPPGTYAVSISMGGYEREERRVEVGLEETATLDVTLKKPGKLVVSGSPEGALVEIEGPGDFAESGGLPLEIEDAPRGDYRVRISREGYDPFETTVKVRPGETTTLPVELAYADEKKPAGESPAATREEVAGDRQSYRTWTKILFWTGVGGLIVAGGETLVARYYGNKVQEAKTVPEARNARDKSRVWMGWAYGGYAVGGTLFIIGAGMWLFEPKPSKSAAFLPAPAPTLDGKGVMVEWRGRW